jgi:HD-GYP domain-containing protein (c-di-GMP phosphodiesterase class II)
MVTAGNTFRVTSPVPLRFAEVAGALAVAQDHCFGQPPGSQQRGCLIAMRMCDALGASAGERSTVYWTALLRYLGCTGHAHEVAVVFGDDITARSRSFEWDPTNPYELAKELFAHAARQQRGVARLRAVASVLAGGRKAAEMNFRTGCEVAEVLALRLGVDNTVRDALAHTFERWNGAGFPHRVREAAIPVAARLSLVARDFEVLARVHGNEGACAVLSRRSGRSYDPELVGVVTGIASETMEYLAKIDPWDESLSVAVDDHPLEDEDLDNALEVVADFADLKSPFTAGHSRGVAELAAAAGAASGLGAADQQTLRRAGLLHDIGRCAVTNAIWDKPGTLTRDERDVVETHSLRSEQLWRRCPGLSSLLGPIGHHHERADGTGYHRGVHASQLPLSSRILAAADCFHALTEIRPHRPAQSPEQAARTVHVLATEGQLDSVAADAVLAGAGHATSRRRSGGPAALTAREVDVLVLIARGCTTKQVATELSISPKTADTHVQHIYNKIGASTRGAAALFAMQHGLIG